MDTSPVVGSSSPARIFKNGEQIWYGKIAEGKNEAKTHDITVSLKEGDKLREKKRKTLSELVTEI